MFSTVDTIVAIATPPGRGGIGVVRVSGPSALLVCGGLVAHRTLQPRRATLTVIYPGPTSPTDPRREIDQAVVTYFPGPASYTGEDVVEISAHGNPVVLEAIVTAAIENGARLAEPGEFTLRAYLNGRIDLVQAEAVADLIDAATPLQARAAFDQLQGTLTRALTEIHAGLFDLIARLEASVDFPDEGYHFADPGTLTTAVDDLLRRLHALLADARRGRIIREGLTVAILGPPNVGKSSLFNALAGAPRAIVSAIPGTTRDLVTETVDIDGIRVTLVDTAGVRESEDLVEKEGVSRALGAATVADLVIVVADGSVPLTTEVTFDIGQEPEKIAVLVASKADLPALWSHPSALAVSATTGNGLEVLRKRIAACATESLTDRPAITNVRHIALIERAREALSRARSALAESAALPEEFVLADLQQARSALEEVTGRRTPDDVLAHIFQHFCVGK